MALYLLWVLGSHRQDFLLDWIIDLVHFDYPGIKISRATKNPLNSTRSTNYKKPRLFEVQHQLFNKVRALSSILPNKLKMFKFVSSYLWSSKHHLNPLLNRSSSSWPSSPLRWPFRSRCYWRPLPPIRTPSALISRHWAITRHPCPATTLLPRHRTFTRHWPTVPPWQPIPLGMRCCEVWKDKDTGWTKELRLEDVLEYLWWFWINGGSKCIESLLSFSFHLLSLLTQLLK